MRLLNQSTIAVKKFAVYSKVKLVRSSDWLDKFQKEYLKEDWHVTLKQACWIRDGQLSDVKNKLERLHKELKFEGGKVDVKFDKLVIDEEKEGGGKTVMIQATDNKPICLLQKKIVEILKDYDDYEIQESRGWERNFKPHLTLASNLREEDFLIAESYLKDDVCEGVIDSVTLVYSGGNDDRERISYKFL